MSDTYTKLFSSITESTIVSEPVATRWLWVTMLAMADSSGCVYGSVPGLARRANISLQETEAALATFYAPDPYSRTRDHEGRRIEDIDGGWRLLNHAKYAAIRSEIERKEYKREWDRENRPSGHRRDRTDGSPTAVRHSPIQSDAGPTKPDSPTPPALTPYPEKIGGLSTHSDAPQEPTLEARACLLMREAGCVQSNPSHPDLIAAIREGVTPETLASTVREGLARAPPIASPFTWAISTARGRHAAGARPITGGNHAERSNRRESASERVKRVNAEAERRDRGSGVIEGDFAVG